MFNKARSAVLLEGYSMAINELIVSAENESCEPFSVYVGDKTIRLINVDCLMSEPVEE